MNPKYFLVFILALAVSEGSRCQTKIVEEVNLTNHSAEDRYVSYSPNGTQIVFESNRDGNWNLYLMDVNGAHQIRLTNDESDERYPQWHPNGKRVLFQSNPTCTTALYEIEGKSRRVKKINFQPAINGEILFLSYHPSGKKIGKFKLFSEKKANSLFLNPQLIRTSNIKRPSRILNDLIYSFLYKIHLHLLKSV